MPTFGKVEKKDDFANNKKEDDVQEKEVRDDKNTDNNETDNENNAECLNEEKQINNPLKQENEELKKKNSELEQKLMYVVAELQNTKRIAQQEKENATKFAINKFVIDAVNIYDVLLTAVEQTKQDETNKNLFDGIKMTIKEFDKMFERIGVIRIEPKEGDIYDFNKHNAISSVSSELPNGTIINMVRAGYELFGRLIRPAMVIVSAGNGEQ